MHPPSANSLPLAGEMSAKPTEGVFVFGQSRPSLPSPAGLGRVSRASMAIPSEIQLGRPGGAPLSLRRADREYPAVRQPEAPQDGGEGRPGMLTLSRRQTLALGAGGVLSAILAGRRPAVAAGETLTIAYQRQPAVLRPDGRSLGGQPDHPGDLPVGLRPLYRPERRTSPSSPGLLTKWGWNDDQIEDRDGGARGRHLARRLAGHARGRRLVAGARRRAEDRQPDPVRLVARSATTRSTATSITGDVLRFEPTLVQVDGLPHRLRAAQDLLREGRRGGLREEADRLRALHGRRVRAQRLPPAQGQPELLGRQAGLRDGRSSSSCPTPRAASPRSRSGYSDVTLEIPYEEFDRLKAKPGLAGVATPISDIGDDLHQRHRRRCSTRTSGSRPPRHRQEGARRPAAARLRRADRHAGGAGVRRLRSHRSRSPYDPEQAQEAARRVRLLARASRSSSPSRRRAASSRRTTR